MLEKKRKDKIVKGVVEKMIMRMNSGKQKAFYVMKLRAKQANFDHKLDQTIKMNDKKLLLEKLTGVNK